VQNAFVIAIGNANIFGLAAEWMLKKQFSHNWNATDWRYFPSHL